MNSELEHHFVKVAGMNTHYIVVGKGPPVILLHGLGASVIAWRDTVGPLSQICKVYAVDIPGHGDSEKPDIPYTSQTGIMFLRDFLEVLDIQQVALTGNSMGGLLALGFALRYPDRVTGLVLVGTAGLGKKVPLFMRLATLPLLGEILEHFVLSRSRAILGQVFSNPRFATEDLRQELTRVRSLPGARRAELSAIRNGVNLWGEIKSDILLDRIQELRIPILIVWGSDDKIIPKEHAINAAGANKLAEMIIVPNCGHWPQIEQASLFNLMLSEFLRKLT